MKKDFDVVNRYQKEIKLIGRSVALMSWDQEVNMPDKGVESRAAQVSYLSGLSHEKFTSNEFFRSVKKLKNTGLRGDNKLIVEKLHKDILKSRKIPKKFVEEMNRAVILSGLAWRNARKEKDFSIFKPYLEKIIKLKRQEAKYLRLPFHIYNGLLDGHEEGITAEELKPKFEKLKKRIKRFVR